MPLRIVIASLLIASLVSTAWAHPSEEYTPFKVSGEMYASMGYLPEWGLGDISFNAPYPMGSSLTPAERYILTGAKKDMNILLPWHLELYYVLSSYHANYGQVPSAISEDVLEKAVNDGKRLPGSTYERFKSPISGRFPRLDSQSFSPGDAYARLLTDAEIRHFTKFDPQLRAFYERQPYPDPRGETVVKGLGGPVFYLRIYGLQGTIVERLEYQGI